MVKNSLLKFYIKVRYSLSNEEGQALAEYGLIIALLAVVCITALSGLGTQISGKITQIVDALKKE